MNYVKWGAIGAALIALSWFWYHQGGNSARAALEGFQAAQAANTAKAVLSERASGAAELARVNTVLKGYQDVPIDPIALSIGSRVFKYAGAASCAVPQAPADPGGTRSPTPLAIGPSEIERALTALAVACSEDARELAALQAAWPQ